VRRKRCLAGTEAKWQIEAFGPTSCITHPKVVKNIAKEFQANNPVSFQELQIARRMGITSPNLIARCGFSDQTTSPWHIVPHWTSCGTW
jgi:hypothetical protein